MPFALDNFVCCCMPGNHIWAYQRKCAVRSTRAEAYIALPNWCPSARAGHTDPTWNYNCDNQFREGWVGLKDILCVQYSNVDSYGIEGTALRDLFLNSLYYVNAVYEEPYLSDIAGFGVSAGEAVYLHNASDYDSDGYKSG